ncbi:polysaccharide biosynthesis/export family protein [uncultured Umboniibacter sp.]|uniref:polysaccharide biosynthesis/export family protein n=1 Tax=uncultured Umboniibacter sp. TaxID=1798917 RepID=UPI0026055E36|nr:polysaccharide biosynthesis/export family protein [uncultured Umboniibacter sp.]
MKFQQLSVLIVLLSSLSVFVDAQGQNNRSQNNAANNLNRQATVNELNAAQNSLNSEQLAQDPDVYMNTRQGMLLPGESDVSELLPTANPDAPPPFGANLFVGGYESERYDGLNSNYLLAPGDKVTLALWGAVNANEVLTVDNQGNIFIPNIGPVSVENVSASSLNNVVTSKVRTVYRDNVSIYVNLLTATPVSVYISGSIIRPGQYAGLASDSIIYYLKRAGGIDPDRGSYRDIQLRRDGEVIASFDLYDFILNGDLPTPTFKDGDVIFVGRQNATVEVSGSVRNPFRFEFVGDVGAGSELVHYALPMAKTSHVGVIGDRDVGPFSLYMPLTDFDAFELTDGDRVMFNDDIRAEVIDVQIEGSYLGPSYYAVKKGARLHDVLALIETDPNLADIQSIYIERESVAEMQRETLEESLNRLERTVFSSPVSSTGEASIRASEASLVLQFTERAREIEPKGRVIVSDRGEVANILLEMGDRIVIPAKTDIVNVSGEVLMPRSIVFNSQAEVEDYIAWAGGFSERANADQIIVVHPNGMYESFETASIQPGDTIMVLPKVSSHLMQSVKDITQVIYQIAIASDVVLR